MSGIFIGAINGGGPPLVWTDVPFSASNFTAQAGTWTVTSGNQVTFRYLLNGKYFALVLTLDGGATSAIATDLFVALPVAITPLREFRGFMLTNAGGASEAGFFYINANIAILNLRRIAGNWPVSANFQVALELFGEVA